MDKLVPSQSVDRFDGQDRPSKVIVLKVRVSDHDLAAGRFRAVAAPPVLHAIPRRRRRGRPRNASLLAAAIATQNSIAELERQQPRNPFLSDFRAISTYSFPLLISSPRGVRPPSSSATPAALSPDTPCQDLELQPIYHSKLNASTGRQVSTPRRGKRPNTMGFWWDSAIAEQAMNSNDVDFKMICLKLMRWRNQNTVPHQPTVSGVTWETMLGDAVARGKAWRRARRHKDAQSKENSGWAVWETRKRSESRGRFVKDGARGAWVLHSPGTDGKVMKILRLGYKRQGRLRRDARFETDIADH